MRTYNALLLVGMTCIAGLSLPGSTKASDTASIIFETNFGDNQLVVGVPGVIKLILDASPDTVAAASYFLIWEFSNGNIVGPLFDTGIGATVIVTEHASEVFESVSWNLTYGLSVTSPDTTLGGFISFGGLVVWDDSAVMHEFRFIPTDTGSIHIKDKVGGTPMSTEIADNHANSMLPEWIGVDILVVECSDANLKGGDANQDFALTSSDVIFLVNYVFKSGSPPMPIVHIGDVDCSTQVSSTDIIFLVNHIFKGGPPPCDVCSVI